MRTLLLHQPGEVRLPPDWPGFPILALAALGGGGEVWTAAGDRRQIPPCHMLILPVREFDQARCNDPPLLLFAAPELGAMPVAYSTPLLLDEVSVAVLLDVFVEHHRLPPHQQAAFAFLCHQAADQEEPPASSPAQRPVDRRVEAYLTEHLDEPVASADLAEAFGCSESHLVRQLRDHGKPPPMKLLALLRVKRARQLLSESDLTVSQVAAMVGMRSLPAFSRFFKRHTGQSPTQYRENLTWLV